MSSDNPAVAQVAGSLTIDAGKPTGSFSVATPGPAGLAKISAALPGATTQSDQMNVYPRLQSFTIQPNSVDGGVATTGTVVLESAAPFAVAVSLTSSSSAAAAPPASVAVAATKTSVAFTISTGAVSANRNVNITAFYGDVPAPPVTGESQLVAALTVRRGTKDDKEFAKEKEFFKEITKDKEFEKKNEQEFILVDPGPIAGPITGPINFAAPAAPAAAETAPPAGRAFIRERPAVGPPPEEPPAAAEAPGAASARRNRPRANRRRRSTSLPRRERRRVLVVVAGRHDAIASAFAAQHASAGVGLLTPADLSRPGWRFAFDTNGPRSEGSAVVGGRVVAVDEISGVLTRLPAVTPAELPAIVPDDRDYVAAEMTAVLLAWLSSLSCRVVNRPTTTCLAGPNWRPERWVYLAAQLGIPFREACHAVEPGRTPSAGAVATDSTAEPLVTVNVVGERCLGTDDERLAVAARRLADAVGAGLLAVHFDPVDQPEGTSPRFVAATPWPDLSRPEVGDAVLDLLTGDAR